MDGEPNDVAKLHHCVSVYRATVCLLIADCLIDLSFPIVTSFTLRRSPLSLAARLFAVVSPRFLFSIVRSPVRPLEHIMYMTCNEKWKKKRIFCSFDAAGVCCLIEKYNGNQQNGFDTKRNEKNFRSLPPSPLLCTTMKHKFVHTVWDFLLRSWENMLNGRRISKRKKIVRNSRRIPYMPHMPTLYVCLRIHWHFSFTFHLFGARCECDGMKFSGRTYIFRVAMRRKRNVFIYQIQSQWIKLMFRN